MFYTIHRAIKLLIMGCVLLVCWKIYERREVFEPGWIWLNVWDNGGFKVPKPETTNGRVLQVVNSQTFVILSRPGGRMNVRLMGLKSPGQEINLDAKKEEFERAKAFREMILGQWVHIDVLYHNENNLGGVAYLGSTNLNAELIRLGYAKSNVESVKGLPKEAQYSMIWAMRHPADRE